MQARQRNTIHTHTYYMHKHINAEIHTNAHTHTHTHTYIHTHTHTQIHTHKHTQHTHYTHTYKYAHSHTQTHKHTHKHTHAHCYLWICHLIVHVCKCVQFLLVHDLVQVWRPAPIAELCALHGHWWCCSFGSSTTVRQYLIIMYASFEESNLAYKPKKASSLPVIILTNLCTQIQA